MDKIANHAVVGHSNPDPMNNPIETSMLDDLLENVDFGEFVICCYFC